MFNWIKTAMLMAAIMALFGIVGGMIGGESGMLLALVFGGAMNVFSYWFSDKMVLKMYNAREVDETSAPQFYGMVRELAQRAGLPMPRVYLINEDQPNAFATGRNPEHAAVAATTGILQLLSARELRGVMAHELAHVAHRDILISTVSATMAGAISALANFAMFFGGRSEDGRPSNPLASIAVALFGAAGRQPDPDGDLACPRVRSRPRWRGSQRRPACPGRCAGQDPDVCRGPDTDGAGRGASGNGADDGPQPAFRRRDQWPVFDASADRGKDCPPAGDGALGPGRRRAGSPARPLSFRAAPGEGCDDVGEQRVARSLLSALKLHT